MNSIERDRKELKMVGQWRRQGGSRCWLYYLLYLYIQSRLQIPGEEQRRLEGKAT